LRQKLDDINEAMEPLVSGDYGEPRTGLDLIYQDTTLESLRNKGVTIRKYQTHAEQARTEARACYETWVKQRDEKLALSLRKTVLRQDPKRSFNHISEGFNAFTISSEYLVRWDFEGVS
jgi:hypothetical protein